MVCKICNKPIYPLSEDYVYWQKYSKTDWYYASQHRRCSKNHKGWILLETKQADYTSEINKAKEFINTLDWNVLYCALEGSKHAEILRR